VDKYSSVLIYHSYNIPDLTDPVISRNQSGGHLKKTGGILLAFTFNTNFLSAELTMSENIDKSEHELINLR